MDICNANAGKKTVSSNASTVSTLSLSDITSVIQ